MSVATLVAVVENWETSRSATDDSRLGRTIGMKTSEHLDVGSVYTRKGLMAQFGITDATINTGIFQPSGHESVWLFVTEKKTPDRTQYEDMLAGDVLDWDSQPSGRKDRLIIEHKERGLELLVFYRKQKYEFARAGFRFEGAFDYGSHSGQGPAHFKLYRAAAATPSKLLQESAVSGALNEAESAAAKKKGQGFSPSPQRRKAVELHAMSVASAHFQSLGYSVKNTSANKPYDLKASNETEVLYVEVKGTSAGGEQVFLTKNEVAHAQAHPQACVLFVVYQIEVAGTHAQPSASGGTKRIIWPWVPSDDALLALSFQYTLPGES